METNGKIKWIGSIFLGCFLLVLALMGGNWGSSYSAEAGVNAPPVIYVLIPDAAAAGSPDKTIIISGSNFGDETDTAVRIRGTIIDEILYPEVVYPDGLSVILSADLLADPTAYLITVVKSTVHSVPTIPITPWDEYSNTKTFTVFTPSYTYLPIIDK
jgi:hypothetical protein